MQITDYKYDIYEKYAYFRAIYRNKGQTTILYLHIFRGNTT